MSGFELFGAGPKMLLVSAVGVLSLLGLKYGWPVMVVSRALLERAPPVRDSMEALLAGTRGKTIACAASTLDGRDSISSGELRELIYAVGRDDTHLLGAHLHRSTLVDAGLFGTAPMLDLERCSSGFVHEALELADMIDACKPSASPPVVLTTETALAALEDSLRAFTLAMDQHRRAAPFFVAFVVGCGLTFIVSLFWGVPSALRSEARRRAWDPEEHR